MKNDKKSRIIYKIYNKKDGSVYIGQTLKRKGLYKRYGEHLKSAFKEKDSRPLYKAIRKDGWRAFKREEIDRVYGTEKDAKNVEDQYILKFRNELGEDKIYNKGTNKEIGKNHLQKIYIKKPVATLASIASKNIHTQQQNKRTRTNTRFTFGKNILLIILACVIAGIIYWIVGK